MVDESGRLVTFDYPIGEQPDYTACIWNDGGNVEHTNITNIDEAWEGWGSAEVTPTTNQAGDIIIDYGGETYTIGNGVVTPELLTYEP